MLLIITVVFVAVFALLALLLVGVSKPKTSRQTEATLTAVLGRRRKDGKAAVPDVRKENRLSAIPWLHSLLARMNFSIDLRHVLMQADLSWTTGKLMLMTVAAWILSGYLVGLKTQSPVVSLIASLAAAAAPLAYVLLKRRSRLRRILYQLPDALDLMVSALRAGHSMANALGVTSKEAPEPIGRELRLCFEEQNFGINLRTAMDNLLERVPLQDLRIAATAMLINKESGGNLAEVLDKTGHVIRDRFRLEQQIRVHTAQGRLTGVVLISLPAIMALILYTTNRPYLELLFTRSMGHRMMAGAAVMNVIGLLIIRKIVNIRI
jgi:tight adherence protein B